MSTSSEQAGDQSTRPRAAAECQPLLAVADQDLFRKNAFRITGLPVDATPREASRHLDELKMAVELGNGFQKHTPAYPLPKPPGMDEIREAIQKLKDPEKRLIDEFFWFWPETFGESKSDPAIRAMTAGDSSKAIELWEARRKSGSNGIAARHNLAVVYHIISLEAEYSVGNGQSISADRLQRRVARWKSSVRKWGRLAGDEEMWQAVSDRIRQINEPALTTGFVRRLRASFPVALAAINAGVIKKLALAGSLDVAKEFVAYVREQGPDPQIFDQAAGQVLSTERNRLKSQIQQAMQNAKGNPAIGHREAESLVNNAIPLLELFDLFFGEAEHFQKEIFDEVASAAVSCLVEYQRKTGDNTTFVRVLERALPLADSVEVRKRIEENIQIGKSNLKNQEHESFYAMLKSIQESKDSPSARLAKFKRGVIPALVKVTGISGFSETHGFLSANTENFKELLDSAAIILRNISIDAWNQTEVVDLRPWYMRGMGGIRTDITRAPAPDKITAISANDLAIKFAQSPNLKRRLAEDKATLQQAGKPATVASEQRDASPNYGAGCLVVVAIFIVLGIIGSCNSTNSSTSSRSYMSPAPASSPPPVPSQTYAPSSYDSGNSDGNVYRVSSSVSSSLKREKAEIESDRTALEALETQIERLGRDIESDRLYLDRTSQHAVDAFNEKVERYNALNQKAKIANAAFNVRVDNYNARLRSNAR